MNHIGPAAYVTAGGLLHINPELFVVPQVDQDDVISDETIIDPSSSKGGRLSSVQYLVEKLTFFSQAAQSLLPTPPTPPSPHVPRSHMHTVASVLYTKRNRPYG